jgi:hypothetical protein
MRLQVGPHGHHLLLKLHGTRNMVMDRLPLEGYTATIDEDSGRCHAAVLQPSRCRLTCRRWGCG